MNENYSNYSQAQSKPLYSIAISSKSENRKLKQSNASKSLSRDFSGLPKPSKIVGKKSLKDKRIGRRKIEDAYVQHDYHDYSLVSYEDVPSNSLSMYHMKHKGGNKMLFPEKLHVLISHAEISDPDIISWAPHGRCFSIRNRERFCQKFLIPEFHIKQFPSFQRQLDRYNFKTITRHGSKDKSSYYHELFLRSRPTLSRRLRGIRNKGNGFKPMSNPQDEPDFYSFPYCYENNQDLETNDPDSPQSDTPTESNDLIGKTNISTLLQDVSQRSTISNNFFPSSMAIPMVPCMFQPARAEHIRPFIVDRMTTIPIIEGRFQLAYVLNTSFPQTLYQNHGNFMSPTAAAHIYQPVPSLLPFSVAPLVGRSIYTAHALNMFTPNDQQSKF